MKLLQHVVGFILPVNLHPVELLQQYESWIYLFLFLIIFCETGLAVTVFLLGGSLLFALATLAAIPALGLNLLLLLVLLCTAAIFGGSFNYFTGLKLENKVYRDDYWFRSNKHLHQAESFDARYGGHMFISNHYKPIPIWFIMLNT